MGGLGTRLWDWGGMGRRIGDRGPGWGTGDPGGWIGDLHGRTGDSVGGLGTRMGDWVGGLGTWVGDWGPRWGTGDPGGRTGDLGGRTGMGGMRWSLGGVPDGGHPRGDLVILDMGRGHRGPKGSRLDWGRGGVD